MRAALLLAAGLLVASPALAEEPPTGTPWLVAGGLTTGAGAVNLVGAPLCLVTLHQPDRMPCAGTSLAFGVVGVAIGIPLLVVGAQKRQRWETWFHEVTVEPRSEGAVLSWRGTW